MKLVLKIAAGVVLAFVILWAANVGVVVALISAFSSAISESFSEKTMNMPQPHSYLRDQTPANPPAPFPSIQVLTTPTSPDTRPRPRKRVIGYDEQWVPGRPLKECLGPDNEINNNVIRCRNGYMKKVPIYSY